MPSKNRYLFTSESVTEGHPDKIADQISDAILDACLTDDPVSRVACETLTATGLVVIAGEITTKAYVDFQNVVRGTVGAIGYDNAVYGFDCNTCAVISTINKQSGDIAMGVDTGGAGDQGMMFGYAVNETEELMPAPISLAHKLTQRLSQVRKSGLLPFLRPDGKSQVTVEYDANGKVLRVDAVVISTQHSETVANDELRAGILKHVIQSVIPAHLLDEDSKYHINPTGRFVIGGPMGDTGLTGRKIIVDTYGGMGRHGGGAFPARIRPRSIAQPPTWHVTSRRTWSPVDSPIVAKCSSHTPSAWPIRSACWSKRSVREGRSRDYSGHHSLALQAHATRHYRCAEPAPSDLSQDGGLRPLRPQRRRLYLGINRQSGETGQRCRAEGTSSRSEVGFFSANRVSWKSGPLGPRQDTSPRGLEPLRVSQSKGLLRRSPKAVIRK